MIAFAERNANEPQMTPDIPTDNRGRRDPDYVRQINLRMGDTFIEMLDALCAVNQRSRRELVEILVHEAHDELEGDPTARITPL